MPRRTNDFQKMVLLIKRHAAHDANVIESKELHDIVTGTPREVDICVMRNVAGHDIIVSIECTKTARRATVEWVDQIISKHGRLPTNKLVLASKRGFTREALTIAKRHNIDTISLNEFDDSSAERLFGGAGSIWLMIFSLNIRKVIMCVSAHGEWDAENVAAAPDTLIYDCNGEEKCTVIEFVKNLLNQKDVVYRFVEQGRVEHRFFVVEMDPVQFQIYLRRLCPPLLRLVNLIKVSGGCNFEVSNFPLEHGILGTIKVAWGTGEIYQTKALLVASEEPGGRKSLSITAVGNHPRKVSWRDPTGG